MLRASDINIAYGYDTVFLMQVGKGTRGAYSALYDVKGDLELAVTLYNAFVVLDGYKKRLLMPSCSKNPVIARQIGR